MSYLLAPLILIPVSCILTRVLWVRYQDEQHLSKLKRVADARKIDNLSRRWVIELEHKTNNR
jgi:hypothetical protein